MLNLHRALRAIAGRQLRWRELLFWTLLLAAFQSLESADRRQQIMGGIETVAFLVVAISSAGVLDGLGLEFAAWNMIDLRVAMASAATGLIAGAAIVIVALFSHQPLGVDGTWNRAVLAVLLGPVIEELVFRGYLMAAALRSEQWLRQKQGDWCSVFATALVFALAHQANNGRTCIQQFCIMAMGTVYGFTRLRLRSTVAAALAHGCYNLALYIGFWVGISN